MPCQPFLLSLKAKNDTLLNIYTFVCSIYRYYNYPIPRELTAEAIKKIAHNAMDVPRIRGIRQASRHDIPRSAPPRQCRNVAGGAS